MKIGIAFDLAPVVKGPQHEGPDDRFEEFDKPETVEAIAEVIRAEGHDVVLLGDGRDFLEKVLADPPDFVFNIAEGEGIGRCREARVPAALEMLGIPYSGSDPLTLSACLDKGVAKRLVDKHDGFLVPGCVEWEVPRSYELPREEAGGVEMLKRLYSPVGSMGGAGSFEPPILIFKPEYEGSSKGIRGRCVAECLDEAVSIYRALVRDYQQPILAESFIDGDEVTVGVVGNPAYLGGTGVRILGTMRVVPKTPAGRFVYSLEVKRDWKKLVDYEAPACLPEAVIGSLEYAAFFAFELLGCRDLARIDFRVRDGIPYFIEANPLPGLAPGTSDLVILAEGHGLSHPDLIRKILRASLARVGLS